MWRYGSRREQSLGPYSDGAAPYAFGAMRDYLDAWVPRAQFVLTVRDSERERGKKRYKRA